MKKIQMNNNELSEFFKKLVLFLRAGMRPADAMSIMAEEESDKELKTFYLQCTDSLDEGHGLSETLSQYEGIPEYAVSVLEVGERVGRTEATLQSLSEYFDRRARTAVHIRNALLYPSVLFTVMIAVIIVLICKVLPIFRGVYASIGGSLTGISAGLLTLGEWLSSVLPYIGVAAGIIIIVSAIVYLVPSLKKRAKTVFVKMTSDRGISRKLNSAHFAEALAMSLSSGMTLEEAVFTAGSLLNSSPGAAERCKKCCDDIAAGEDPFEVLTAAELLPKSSCRMLILGMRAGDIDRTMEEVADKLSRDAEEALAEKVARIEPALVLVTSLLVGAILLAVMLPLVDIMNVI